MSLEILALNPGKGKRFFPTEIVKNNEGRLELKVDNNNGVDYNCEILEPKSWFILIHDHDPEHLKNIFLKNERIF